MTRLRALALLVILAHLIVAIWHLFLAAKILPAPNNVSWLAMILITSLHFGVSTAVWKLSDRLSGLVSLIFFLVALSADLYEHFLHATPNNVFIASPGDWAAWFDASVFVLLILEILGCSLGILLLPGSTKNNKSTSGLDSNLGKQDPGLSSNRRSRGEVTTARSLSSTSRWNTMSRLWNSLS